jgi:hypothetical protein
VTILKQQLLEFRKLNAIVVSSNNRSFQVKGTNMDSFSALLLLRATMMIQRIEEQHISISKGDRIPNSWETEVNVFLTLKGELLIIVHVSYEQ